MGIVHFFSMFFKAKYRIFFKASSLGKEDLVLIIFLKDMFRDSMASVLTTESVEAMGLKAGDSVELIIKAIHVLPVKE